MKLNELMKVVTKSKKRLGRGLGSGKGKTGGRGTKGQKARGHLGIGFTGGGLPLYKKLPLKRGKGNPSMTIKSTLITLESLNSLKANSIVGIAELIEAQIITKDQGKSGVKVLNKGELNHPLTVKLSVSSSVKAKIEQKGGSVENV